MRLVKFDPIRNLTGFNTDFGNAIDEFFGAFDKEPAALKSWNPRVDISEDKDSFFATFELPGVKKEDVAINVDDGYLTVKGEKKSEEKVEEKNYHRTERTYGSFERSFRLGDGINIKKIDAAFADGLLKVTLPKSEKAKPVEISIK